MAQKTPRRVVIDGLVWSAVIYVLLGGLAIYFIETGRPTHARNLIVILGGILAAVVWISVIEARRTWMGLPTSTADTQWPAAIVFVVVVALLLALGV